MASLVTLVMLLAFLMGSGYNTPDRLSKKYNEDPWSPSLNKSAKVSHDKWRADPWSDLNKNQASQKKYQAAMWAEDCN
ncbi:MAG: hypothetical protein ABII96_01535 [Candidatus Zixiibacteriota bacterium]